MKVDSYYQLAVDTLYSPEEVEQLRRRSSELRVATAQTRPQLSRDAYFEIIEYREEMLRKQISATTVLSHPPLCQVGEHFVLDEHSIPKWSLQEINDTSRQKPNDDLNLLMFFHGIATAEHGTFPDIVLLTAEIWRCPRDKYTGQAILEEKKEHLALYAETLHGWEYECLFEIDRGPQGDLILGQSQITKYFVPREMSTEQTCLTSTFFEGYFMQVAHNLMLN
jgi:hypothetical protein